MSNSMTTPIPNPVPKEMHGPFNLERFKAGGQACTNCGWLAEFKAVEPRATVNNRVIASIINPDGYVQVKTFSNNGRQFSSHETSLDLFMVVAPVKPVVYVAYTTLRSNGRISSGPFESNLQDGVVECIKHVWNEHGLIQPASAKPEQLVCSGCHEEYKNCRCDKDAPPKPMIKKDCCGHASDCAIHNSPAIPVGKCNCGFEPVSATAKGMSEVVRLLSSVFICGKSLLGGSPPNEWTPHAISQRVAENLESIERQLLQPRPQIGVEELAKQIKKEFSLVGCTISHVLLVRIAKLALSACSGPAPARQMPSVEAFAKLIYEARSASRNWDQLDPICKPGWINASQAALDALAGCDFPELT